MRKKNSVKNGIKQKKIALSILLIPSIFFLTFALGETAAGDKSGLSHLTPFFVVLIFGFIAYKFAFACGIILTLAGIASLILYVFTAKVLALAVITFVILPLIVSGLLLLTSSRPK